MTDKAMRILFLEDDPDFAQLIKEMVDQYILGPHKLLHAGTLKQAFALLEKQKFDVGLIDLHLPDSAGIETIIRLRAQAPQLPMVVLTGQKEEEFARSVLDAGAQEFLLKEEVLPTLLIRVLKYAIERKQAEIALKESEHRQKVILESAQVGILVIEPKSHTIVEANPAALKMFGRNKMEVVGQVCHELICPAEKDKCPITDLKQTLDSPEHELVTADGRCLPILKTANIIMLGGKEHLLETFLDISEITKAKDFLEKSHEHLEREVQQRTHELETAKKQWEATFDAVPDLIAIIDLNYNIIRANKSLAKKLNRAPRDLIGRTCWEVLQGRECPLTECPQPKVFEKGEGCVLELWNPKLKADLLISVSPLKDSSGKVYAAVHVARDISDLKRAERSIKEQFDFLQLMVETVPNPIFVKNRQGVFTGCNQAFCDFLGLTREGIVGKTAYDVAPKELADTYHAHDIQLLEKLAIQTYETKTRHAQGESRDVIFYKAPYYDTQGRPAGLVGVMVDITERKQMEEQMLRSQKLEAIGQLAAGIAHEINTPIQFIHTNLEYLGEAFGRLANLAGLISSLIENCKTQSADKAFLRRAEETLAGAELDSLQEDIKDALGGSMEGVERITKIVESMRYFAHPGTAEKTYIDVNRAIEHAVTVSRNEWKYYADLEIDLDPSTPSIKGYSAPFSQTLLNLIVNASQAISEKLGPNREGKGKITISTRQAKGWMVIRIGDTGIGIPEGVLPKIFDPFFTTKPVGKGTGQGLALAQNVIVVKHGGKIEVETEQGKGTTFILYLPAAGN